MRLRTKTALILMAIISVALTFVIDAISPTVAAAAPIPVSGTIGFDTDNYTVNEADGTITLTLQRQGGNAGAIEVQFATTDGTATNGDDYDGIPTPITITWPDGNTNNRTVTLPITPDLITEPNETFTATITATNPDWLGTPTTTTITIVGTGPAPTPTPPATPTPAPTATSTPGPSSTSVPSTTPVPPAPAEPVLPPLQIPTPTPDPITGPLVSGAISHTIEDDTVRLTIPAGLAVWLDPAEVVTVRRNPVVFDGPLPTSRIISFPLSGTDHPFDVTFATRLNTGAVYTEVVRITPPQAESHLPHVSATAATDGQPAPGTRILLNPSGEPSAPTELAVTGSHTTTLLILTGFLLVSGAAFVAYSHDIIRRSRFTF